MVFSLQQPVNNPFTSTSRVVSSKGSQVLLLTVAAATVLSFGVRPQSVGKSVFWWLVRVGGASCAITALCRTPKQERYDPVADLITTHQFQVARRNVSTILRHFGLGN